MTQNLIVWYTVGGMRLSNLLRPKDGERDINKWLAKKAGKMKRFYKSVGFLFFAFAGMTASALNIEVASGYAERRQIGEFEVLFVKSNSTLRISGKSGVIDVLAVGGGGGGATCFGGGGGGGAVVERHDVAVMPGDYEITIGAGGIKGYESSGVCTEAGKGGDTSAFGITAPGGGAGGLWGWSHELNVGATGGGAGAIGINNIYVAKNGLYRGGEYFSIAGAPGTAGLGYGGGACTNVPHKWTSFGGGGGGAGGPGGDARGCSVAGGYDGMAGAGGIGVCSIITGEPLWYGGGGGGGANRCIGRAEGGKGGGGRGSVGYGRETESLPEAGKDFTGGGGGGGSSVNGNAFYPGGAGGCGIVIVRYRRKDASPVRAVEVVGDGLVERKIYGGYECLIVKSNAVLHVNGSQQVDVLAVGGGGGGATLYGGGGGGGGVVERYGLSVPAGDYLAVVGQGGAGGFENHGFKEAEAGGLSSIFGVEALGGGAGGLMGWGEQSVGASGGGAGALGPEESYISKDGLHHGGEIFSISGAPGIDGLGFHGGACTNLNNRFYCYGGGGGGAGGPGQDAVYNGDPYKSMAGAGGAGRSSSITGELVYYGGGGGGGACRAKKHAAGGIGGGGSGGSQELGTGAGENGTDFCGGGGGGARSLNVGNGSRGGRGGSGLIVVRYRYNAQITSTVHEEGIANGGDVYRRFRGFGIHMFSKDGTFSLYEPATVDLLLVGGGGGGGGNRGGGGGGGGVAIMTNVVLQAGTYEVMVGEGGVGEPRGRAGSSRAPATNGGSSSITNAFGFSVSVLGGGAGGNGGWASGVSNAGKDGACGGGGGMPGYWTAGNSSLGGKGVPYQGCDGGCSVNGSDTFRTFGGGGGGAGKRGEDAVYGSGVSTYGAGKGGDGLCCDFSGKSLYYGGGGGGGNGGRPIAGVCVAGGIGGGGAGGFGDRLTDEGITYSDGADGVAGTGGGGGGGGGDREDGGAGGHGGSGVVIIRYHLKKGGVCIVVR